MHYIYTIKSISRKFSYIGMTENVKNRVRRHNQNLEKATRGRGPFKLVFMATVANRRLARSWEQILKEGFIKEKIRRIIYH